MPAEMLLIFDLGQLDISAVTDYGGRKGFGLTYRQRELPSSLPAASGGSVKNLSGRWLAVIYGGPSTLKLYEESEP